jgi:hypothetical protein
MPDDEVIAYMYGGAEITGAEDAVLVERIQIGLRCGGYKPDSLVIDGIDHGERENGVHHFSPWFFRLSMHLTLPRIVMAMSNQASSSGIVAVSPV